MEYRCHSYIRVTRAVNSGWLCFRERFEEVIGSSFRGRTQDSIEAVSICTNKHMNLMPFLQDVDFGLGFWDCRLEKVDIFGFNWSQTPWIRPGIVSWMIHFFGFLVGQPGTFLGYWVSPEWNPSSSKTRKRQNGILFWSPVFWSCEKNGTGHFQTWWETL